jgi:Leucine-rich repeat (LRR) protein
MHSGNFPYLYGVDISFNSFSSFPYEPLDASGLTVLAVRSQRNEKGERCLREWPTGIGQHKGLRGLYLGSNDLRKIDDSISTLIYYLDISDNPNIIFDAADICYAWQVGAYILIYDKSQNILNCDPMLN